ncbi:uncharacterized protein I303_106881 [Kwoniella dejecticola CBS 10117]|uniref:Uncharacterized protein n=1 Tax=Kwoniella dejecticola CBS 10117 TaxID=1296121 RepID=A0A1A5ZTF9_9TREE|nr:uncharacterized protein I303_08479 [Kwoniella dejecticola CBS 10117]OBR81097.1 hypothetical protein I303_08479 [Kwoniella dejecticola CBS 10117]
MIHPPESEYPPNIRFIKRDILAPLPQEWLGRFDIVHARFLITGIKDFPALIRRLSTLLKSGGYLVILEPELKCRLTTSSRSSQDEGAEHSTAKTLEEVCPGIARYNKIALQAMQSFGMDMQATSKIPSYILESGSFEEQSVKTQCKELPMSDWSEDPRMKQIGECQLSNSLAYPDTIKRMVLASSIIDEVEFEIAKKGYQDDIRSGQGRPVLPIWCIWAKRK